MPEMPTPLPWEPESIESLRNRFCNAFETKYNVEAIARGSGAMPAFDSRQIFDFDEGRMCISVDGDKKLTLLHMSASFIPDFWKKNLSKDNCEFDLEKAKQKAVEIFNDISDRKEYDLNFVLLSPGILVLHFFASVSKSVITPVN